MHVRITRPDGTVIDVDGTPQECAALLDTITVVPAQVPPAPTPFIVPLPYIYPQYPVNPLPYPFYTWSNTGITGLIPVSETTLPQD